jgi:hypothetical protein
MKKMQMLMTVAVMFSLSGFLSAGEMLDIKGDFSESKRADGIPVRWESNKPGYWENTAKVSLKKIPDTEKNALQVTSQTKAIHLYSTKRWSIATGDKCIIKAMVKGKGKGGLGVYSYPGSGMPGHKEFTATEEWTEFIVEIIIPKRSPEEINEIAVVITVSPGASIEFADVTAEIVKKQE